MWRLVLQLGPGCGLKICAVSRALGDIDYKRPRALLSAVPDVFHVPLKPHADRFAVFATDGVWAVLSDQQAVDCVAAALALVSACLLACLPVAHPPGFTPILLPGARTGSSFFLALGSHGLRRRRCSVLA